ncbi:hypothetical protein [Streptomyces sp. NPDC057623]|uniref:hypothetical protein n=1 Tax=Streptomyces sp. NPDC057623 TaxID=3346187 RepID=UPI0036B0BB88
MSTNTPGISWAKRGLATLAMAGAVVGAAALPASAAEQTVQGKAGIGWTQAAQFAADACYDIGGTPVDGTYAYHASGDLWIGTVTCRTP